MNRNDEFNKLKDTLNEDIVFLPKEDYGDIMKKFDKYNTRKRVVNSVVSSLCAFALVVNIFPSVAYAMYNIPFIGNLTKVVSFSTSLTRAVEQDYVQYLGQSQTKDGITVTLEHMIADQKQMYLFFNADDLEGNHALVASPTITWEGMTSDDSLGGSLKREYEHYLEESTGLEKRGEGIFVYSKNLNNNVPESVDIKITAKNYSSTTLDEEARYNEFDEFYCYPVGTDFEFTIDIDPKFIESKQNYHYLNKTVELEGQKLTITVIEINPSQISVIVKEDENNTAYIDGLEMYLKNEKGEILTKPTEGAIASSTEDRPYETIYYMESDYFSDSQNLTLYIDAFELLDKDKEFIKADLKNGIFEYLPLGMEYVSTTQEVFRGEPCYLIDFTFDNSHSKEKFDLIKTYKKPKIAWLGVGSQFIMRYKTDDMEEHYFFSETTTNIDDNYDYTITYYIEEDKYSDIIYLTPAQTSWVQYYANPIEIPLI